MHSTFPFPRVRAFLLFAAAAFVAPVLQAQTYVVSTLAGTPGTTGNVDATGAAARFNDPVGIAVDGLGNLYLTEMNNEGVRRITPAGVVSTFTANGQDALGLAFDNSGNIVSANHGRHVIGRFSATGAWTQLAGQSHVAGAANGTGAGATFNGPHGIVRDSAGNYYVSDSINHTIRKIAPGWVVTTLAGSPGLTGSANGTGAAARFNSPTGIAVDGSGNLYVAEYDNHTVRKITPAGVVTTFAGVAGVSGSDDGSGAGARFWHPIALAVDASGNVFVGELGSPTIRKITPAGVVTTIAGQPGSYGASDGLGRNARFVYPYAMTLDAAGNLYVADASKNTIRKLMPITAPAPGLALDALSRVVTEGGSASWTATLSDGTGYAYQWRHDGRPIAGATTAGLQVNSATRADGGTYEVVATKGTDIRRAVVKLHVAPARGAVALWGSNDFG
ncbi:MAG: hypothetical protein V4773_28125, partial [Verrucomicrobiota bacterium]